MTNNTLAEALEPILQAIAKSGKVEAMDRHNILATLRASTDAAAVVDKNHWKAAYKIADAIGYTNGITVDRIADIIAAHPPADAAAVAGEGSFCANIGRIPNRQDISEAMEAIKTLTEFAYRRGYHEFGYDPVEVIEAVLHPAPAEPVGRSPYSVDPKYTGPVVSFDVTPPYYLASCDKCGWVGSSEHCGTDSGLDDSDVYCPRCHASGADCGKVAEKIGTPEAGEPVGLREAEKRGEQRAIARIVNAARAIGFQAGVGGRETAGAIVSYLATSPDEIAPFIAGELSPLDFAGDWMRGGCLTWHAVNGKVVSPEDLALTRTDEAQS